MESDFSPAEALAALEWQIELGVQDALSETPINRYELDPVPQKAAAAPPAQAAARATRAAPEDPVAVAQAAANASSDLEGLHAALESFQGSDLREGARNCVFSDGLPGARVMIVGEAPGREEDQQGKPFIGRAGQMLDRMFAAIGLSRDAQDPEAALYITNVLPWRPPQNRTPSAAEIAMFLPFLKRHIALARPEILVVMGNTPAQALLGRTGITRMRGKWEEAADLPCMPMFHPAYLLRNPPAKREAWADLLTVKARLRA